MQKPVFFSNFAPFFMETTVNTSNFEQFYRTLFPRLVQFAMAYTENEADAEDIVQQAMIKLWTLLQENEGALEGARTFLYTIVRNACIDYVKHNAIVQEQIIQGMDEPVIESLCQWDLAPSVEQLTIYQELQVQVQQLIDSMPEKQREVFLLSRNDNLKNQEIADRLGIGVKAVERHITAALKFLREQLKYKNFILFIFFM